MATDVTVASASVAALVKASSTAEAVVVAGVFGSVAASDKTVAASVAANTVTIASDTPSAAAAANELTAAFAERSSC